MNVNRYQRQLLSINTIRIRVHMFKKSKIHVLSNQVLSIISTMVPV